MNFKYILQSMWKHVDYFCKKKIQTGYLISMENSIVDSIENLFQ